MNVSICRNPNENVMIKIEVWNESIENRVQDMKYYIDCYTSQIPYLNVNDMFSIAFVLFH